jgi:hypothetical protein|tara:strand:+ start:184 stop:564 length:381 start_codon:yes stop_codon:yes gene_type:complete
MRKEFSVSLENITVKDLKEIIGLFAGSTGSVNNNISNKFNPFEIGKAYLIRTVTHIEIGIVKEVGDTELVLSDCSWIADTGRYHDAIKEGVDVLDEVEPYIDDVIVGRGSIIDATVWRHDLPRSQK